MSFVIAVENSTWNNIGDAFYQLSLQNCLKQTLPNATITSFDGPFRRAFRPRGFAKNGYDARFATMADHYVFSGPILGEGFFEEYAPLIEQLTARGASYSLLSVHAYAKGALLERMHAFFRDHPPTAFQTRDNFTFKKFNTLDVRKYDGICFAFFVSKLPGIPTVRPDKPFIALSYHSGPDPKLSISRDGAGTLIERLSVEPRKARNWRFARHIDFMRTYETEVGGYDIVRPVHGFYPSPHLTFARPGSFITYNPLNFLAIYAHCEAVVTDRVHAGVAALSHGNPAYVSSIDSRYAIFERAPVTRHGDFLVLDAARLEEEYKTVLAWLSEAFSPLIKAA